MKKILFAFLLSSAIFTSCQSSDFDEVSSNNENINTRATVENPIDQILGMPIHLKLSGLNHNSTYLSANPRTRNPSLYHIDDNSGRQQWIISKVNGKYMIKVQEGVTRGWFYLGLMQEETQGTWPRMQVFYTDNNMLWNFEKADNSDLYHIAISNKNPNSEVYLSAISTNRTDDLTLSKYSNSDLQLWEISPIETFEILDIQYSLSSADYIKTKPSFVSAVDVYNSSNIVQSVTVNFQSQASEVSTFTKTQGVSTTISAGGKVGLPIITEGSVNISTSTSQTSTYGVTQTQADTRSYAFPVNIPPYTSLKAKAIVTMYDLSISYTMTLKGNSSGKLITEKGKWTGVKAGNIDYQILDKSGTIVKSISGTPSSIVNLK